MSFELARQQQKLFLKTKFVPYALIKKRVVFLLFASQQQQRRAMCVCNKSELRESRIGWSQSWQNQRLLTVKPTSLDYIWTFCFTVASYLCFSYANDFCHA